MEKYVNVIFGGMDYFLKYIGEVKLEEIEDAFSSYIESHDIDDLSDEEIIDDVMNSFKGIEWQRIYPYHIEV